AGKFAIKESIKKSIPDKIRISDIITSHKKSRPVVTLRNNRNYFFFVSVSHDANIAAAAVISMKIDFR
ncbi:MAG: 4-phosphopantetheinyl transferase, partial [Candidatus Nitrosotenuis sp.]